MFFFQKVLAHTPSPEETQKAQALQKRLKLNDITPIGAQDLKLLVNANKPVLMLYWSQKCLPCVSMWNLLRWEAPKYPDITFVSVVTQRSENDRQAMTRDGFTSVPSLQLSYGPKRIRTHVGELGMEEIASWIPKNLAEVTPGKSVFSRLLNFKKSAPAP